ncbi:hypothetical protein I4F81_001588 [Pyropia yezoensis]|uniref:Uncharacterized protein n=1 Tax=Pyropia yezoensis TaxID=2788 RepID=A0ACC3BM12_PYRYE|nr:hypothetical protein I4F81_001588 [Neopyropia yezoensis]
MTASDRAAAVPLPGGAPPPAARALIELAAAPPAVQARFRAARLALFVCIAASYAAYVLLRSAFTFVAPALRPALGLSLAQVGAISSVFPFAYGGSRLLTGVAADGASPAVTLAAGLFLAGASTVAMGAATSTTIRTVARNRSLRALSAAYFLVYFVRQGLKSWLPFALGEVKAFPPATVAVLLSSLELAGVAGSFTSGIASDAAGGRRVAVTLAYLGGLVLSLAAFAAAPPGGFVANAAAAAAAGFCINGPQVLIGLIGAEATRGKGTATALGVLGIISYMGAAVAGWPLTVVIQRGGWGVFGGVIVAAVVAACAVLAPMWKMSEANAAAKEE